MAKDKVNKSEEVRAEFKKDPDARPSVVVATLKDRGIEVSPAQVSQIKKKLGGGKKPAGRKTGPKASTKAKASKNGASTELTMADLRAVKTLVADLGVEKVQAGIEALSELNS